MDPNALSNLDPKLRETYERVMGTTGSTPPTPPSQANNPATSTPQAPVAVDTAAKIDNTISPAIETPKTDTPPASPATQSSTFFTNIPTSSSTMPPSSQPSSPAPAFSGPSSSPVTPTSYLPGAKPDLAVTPPQPASTATAAIKATAPHSASPVLRIVYILGAVAFFVIYTFFWIKIFNLKLPF